MPPSPVPVARSLRLAALGLSVVLLPACGRGDGDGGGDGGTGTRVPARVEAVGGTTTLPSATVNTAVTPAPAVRVVDAGGVAVPNVQVTFAVTAGGGAVTPAAVTTDADGVARATSWTLGQQVGAQRLTATAAGVTTPVVLTSTATAGAASSVAFSAGAGQSANVGTALATRPTARVTDQFGNPVAGATVAFATAGAGHGTVAPASATTNADGVATTTAWTLGSLVGAQRLTATVGTTSATLTATGTAAGTPTVSVQSGSGQEAVVRTSVATPPSVIVRDASGRALGGVTVTFTASGDGVVTGGTQTTSADGLATVGGWQLASVAGANVLTARVTGVGAGDAQAQAFATGTAGPPSRVFIRQQPAYVPGSTRQVIVQVQRVDDAGNVVTGTPATIVAAVASGPGTITAGGSATTDPGSGIAVMTLTVSAPGTYTFVFSIPAFPTISTSAPSEPVVVP